MSVNATIDTLGYAEVLASGDFSGNVTAGGSVVIDALGNLSVRSSPAAARPGPDGYWDASVEAIGDITGSVTASGELASRRRATFRPQSMRASLGGRLRRENRLVAVDPRADHVIITAAGGIDVPDILAATGAATLWSGQAVDVRR